jgi:SET domain-containing protein
MFNFLVEVKESINKDYGLGLFAKEKIPKNSVVWQFNTDFDIKFHIDQFNKLSNTHQNYFKKYGWMDNNYIYSSCDFTNFLNHSFNPNLIFSGDLTIAKNDINIDEELFVNYQEFDEWFDEYKHILK